MWGSQSLGKSPQYPLTCGHCPACDFGGMRFCERAVQGEQKAGGFQQGLAALKSGFVELGWASTLEKILL